MKYVVPNWSAPNHIRAFTTTKLGWDNLGRDRESVTSGENKEIIDLLDLPAEPIWIKQIHTNIAIEANVVNKNAVADASFTKEAKQVCVVLTADCLPVFLTDVKGTQVAAIHAGWRGLAANIIEETFNKMDIAPKDVIVWLGPAIGPKKFEVGIDVYDAFVSNQKDADKAFKPIKDGKWLADLYLLSKLRLQTLGIDNVYGGDFCTYTQENLFYSYRRDGKNTGRMASLIWINEMLK